MGKHKDRPKSRERHHKKRKKEHRERSYSEESESYSRPGGRSDFASVSPPPKRRKARSRSSSISPSLRKHRPRQRSNSVSPHRWKHTSRHRSSSVSPPPRKHNSRPRSTSASPQRWKRYSRHRSGSVSPMPRQHDSRHRSSSLSPQSRKHNNRNRSRSVSPQARKYNSRSGSHSASPQPRKHKSRQKSRSVSPQLRKHKLKQRSLSHSYSPPPKKQSSRRKSRSASPPQKKRKAKHKSKSSSRHEKSQPSKSNQGDCELESSDSSSEDQHSQRGQTSATNPVDLLALQEERRRQKELLKAVETPEEKRARRLAKKEAKERKRKERMGWDKDYSGYTNADNPFGDEHLLDTFTWSKKMEKEGKKHLTQADLQALQRKKMDENRRELEKVKKRRLEREREMEQREKEREAMQREKEADYYREWEKQEDYFHLNQAKLRSKIRIQDGRAKPIDLLAKYISAEDDELAIEMHEPYTYLYGLTIQDLEDLLEDIKVYLELEQGKNVDYWRDIITVTEDELANLRKMDPASREFYGDRREGVHTSVNREVEEIFKGKTTKQLRLLEASVQHKLLGGEGVDVGYWEALLQQLKAHMARTRLRERHQDVLRQKLLKLKREQGIEPKPLFPVQEASEKSRSPQPQPEASAEQPSTSRALSDSPGSGQGEKSAEDASAGSAGEEESEVVLTEADVEEPVVDEYEAGGYSPKLFAPGDVDIDAIIYDPIDDLKKLELAREQVLTIGKVKLDTEGEFERKAKEGMNAEEAQFSVEMPVEKQAFLWSDKYRPRKPRFFNRVHTGFEWNKYNQTHYDIDNPPPKIVQGYKFNIFFPDLIDKTQTPQYTVTPMEDNKDFACLRFHAGPPYEDIAFKIVNREWEYSYKRGFRCQFHNNIFQLWFHFKRYRYRR